MQIYYPNLQAIQQQTLQLESEQCKHCRQTHQLVSHGFIRRKRVGAQPEAVGMRRVGEAENHIADIVAAYAVAARAKRQVFAEFVHGLVVGAGIDLGCVEVHTVAHRAVVGQREVNGVALAYVQGLSRNGFAKRPALSNQERHPD